ncbi:unnamed protein product [Hyaloperonospora brassicae]|uniref:RxLR effector candidate protein n=1 Tax=Hyaloperonospora brassicae TaxID=162125 RepID=A0AAV0TDK7_HYABA|nr:unnamed protein product [Hyaloperonospora brassicae]
MRSLVLAAIGSFLCGSAASVAPDDVRSHAVAFNQSTLLRLHDAAPGDPGPLKSHGKAVGTTASVGPRLLPDSAVDGTGLDNEQREERGFDPVKSLHSLRDDMWVFLTRRSPASVFDKFVRPKEPVTIRAIVQWLEYVDTPEAKNFYHSEKEPLAFLALKLSSDQKERLALSLGHVAASKHFDRLQHAFAESLPPESDVLVNVWKQSELGPFNVLQTLEIESIATKPNTAVQWIRYNEGLRRVEPTKALRVDEVAQLLFLGPNHAANKAFKTIFELPAAAQQDDVNNLLKKLRGTHVEGRDDLDNFANDLQKQYNVFTGMSRERSYQYKPSPGILSITK